MTNEQLAEQVDRLIDRIRRRVEQRIYLELSNDYRAGWREGLHSLRDELLDLIRGAEVVGVEEAARRVT